MNIKENILAIEKWEDRKGNSIDGVVIHSMTGFYKSTISWFNRADVIASAHYLISKTGEISKCIEEKNAAWHTGEVTVPYDKAPKIIKEKWGVNPNLFTIGIEMEDENNKDYYYPQKQYFACVELVADILKRNDKQASNDTILMHKEINPINRSDPIGNWNHDRFIADVKQAMDGDVDPGVVAPLYRYKATITLADWVDAVNMRSGASTKFDVLRDRGFWGQLENRVLKKAQKVNVIGFVKGERVSYDTKGGTINTQFWWVTDKDEYIWSGGTAWVNGKQVVLTLDDFPKSINLQRDSK